MSGMRRIGGVVAIAAAWGLVGSCVAQTPPALQAPLALQGAGPFYRLTLPAAIYGHAAFDDLRDVRVRNAAQQPVPFAWLDAEPDAAPVPVSRAASLFAVPLAAGGSGSDELVGLKLRGDGTLALAPAKTAPATSTNNAAAWIIDARQIDGAVVQARFTLASDAQGVFPFSVDASDDLRDWRPVIDDDQFVRLAQGGRAIERLAIELDRVRARFLRLRWHDPAHAPGLATVELDSVQQAAPVAALEWSEPVRAGSCGADYCDYAVPRHLPLQSLRIALADPNTLAKISIASLRSATAAPSSPPRNALYVLRHGRAAARANAAATETTLVDSVIYRLTQPGGEVRSAALALDGGTHTTLRLRTSGAIGVLGSAPPTLSFGSRPRALVFLAQGQAPFTLNWPATAQPPSQALAAPLALAQLIPGQRADQKLAADVATVSLSAIAPIAASVPAVDAAAEPSRKPWLWGALAGGLVLLGAMAWSLLRSLKTSST